MNVIILFFGFFMAFLSLNSFFLIAQSPIDHWETVVFAEDDWKYFVGETAPISNWNKPIFVANEWQIGQGGIGYGDGDDNTLIPNTVSLYMRRQFILIDTSKIALVILHADYDDAFVAYLNGVEIARSNIGQIGIEPAYDEVASTWREAEMFEGGNPQAFIISEETLKSIVRNGPNILAIQVHNQAFDSSDMSAIFFLSVAINDSSEQYESTPDWFNESLFFLSSDLPLIAINTNGQTIVDEPRVVAQMGIIDNGEGNRNFWADDFNHYNGQISIEIRGSSSQAFDKKNYSLETQDANGDNLNISLLGMPEENDWVLHGPFSDKSLMRNVLSYHIGRAMGRYAPRTRYCELMINGQYRGVYVLTEKVKRDANRVDIANVRPQDVEGDELTGGYLLNIDRDNGDPADGFYSVYPVNHFYSFEEPDFDELQTEQRNYIVSYIRNFENAINSSNYATAYEEYIDVPSLVDYVIANELTKEIDAYRLSTYLYKRKDSNGGKLHFGPLWDMNLSFGNYDYCPENPEGWAYQFNVTCGTPLPFWINRLMNIAAVRNQMNCRWFELRQGPLHTDSLLQFINERAAQLEEAQVRNFTQWDNLDHYVWPNSFIGGSYEAELSFLKDWLIQRLLWMDANMVGNCTMVATTKEKIEISKVVHVYPNPFNNQLIFDIKTPLQNAHIFIDDMLGRNVAILRQNQFEKNLIWNGMDKDGKEVKPGIYVYRIEEKTIIAQGKVIKH